MTCYNGRALCEAEEHMAGEIKAERIPVLMYHRIGEPRDQSDCRFCVRPGDFARQMVALAAHGYRPISIDAFFAWLNGSEGLEKGAFLITFDDGFRGVYEHAF